MFGEILICHLIGDFIIQNDWMAQNKKKSSFHCAVHVLTYMIPFLFIGLNWWQLVLIAIQHFILDRTNFVGWFMEIKGSKGFRDGILAPWSWVTVDNSLHLIWMYFVMILPKLIG